MNCGQRERWAAYWRRGEPEMSKEDVTGDVSGDHNGAGDSLCMKPRCAGRGWSAEQASEKVHHPAVCLFGQIRLTRTKAGLNVHEGQIFLTSGQRAAQGAVGITNHDNHSRAIAP
jgi:hypothetical protein